MHSFVRERRGRRAFAVGHLLLAVGIASAAGLDAVADISITPGAVTWSPRVTAEKWLLTVSGQGIHLRQVVEDGEPLRLQTSTPDGERIADGSYNWELRAIRPSRAQERRAKQLAPAARSRSQAWFERRVSERPIVTFGSLQVNNGAFVMPLGPERTR